MPTRAIGICCSEEIRKRKSVIFRAEANVEGQKKGELLSLRFMTTLAFHTFFAYR